MKAELLENGIPAFETMIRRSASFQKTALSGVPVSQIRNSLAAGAASPIAFQSKASSALSGKFRK